jgi:predicted transcriptional regulator
MKRSKEDIVEQILDICKKPTNKTGIVYSANLNFRRTDKYLSSLINAGVLEASKELPITYKTNSRGEKLLGQIKALNAQLDYIGEKY